MGDRVPFQYATLRVVPRVERGEFINAGVIVYSQAADYLGARIHLDRGRLAALAPDADADTISAALQAASDTCAGDGPAAAEPIGKRFHWLVAPRSTVVQPSPVHTGLTADPARELDHLLRVLVTMSASD